MGYIYQVVGEKVEWFKTKDELTKKYNAYGTETGTHLRRELQGQPRLNALIGPMYGGQDGGKTVIRYETQEAYDRYST